MNRLFVIVALLLLGSAPVDAAPPKDSASKTKEAEAKDDDLPLDADSRESLIKFVNGRLKNIMPKISTQPDEAEKLAKALMEALDSATAKTESGKQFLAEAKGVMGTVLRRIAVARLPFEDVAKALRENPENFSDLTNYGTKIQMMVDAVVDDDPDKATEIVEGARKLLSDVEGRAEGEATKNAIGRQLKSLARFDRAIKSAQQIAKLLGTDAAPLEAEAWVNGSALTAADLQGKVVLLDFWAVWCGPCIATFPHLKEWHDKYAKKGLVIVGVTSYYGFDWDDDENGPKRQANASHEQEQVMLAKFAKHHELEHRFAIENERGLSDHYGVSGIPHVVLIDRQGKVAMVRVGNSEQNAQSLEAMIEKLVVGKKEAEKGGAKAVEKR